MDQDIRHSRKPCRHIRWLQFHLLLVALLYPAGVSGQVGDTFAGPVIRVVDGDTISVRRDGETVRIRLDGIDTPESDQPFGTTASGSTGTGVTT